MTSTHRAPVGFYRAAEVAAMLQCSQWWIKEKARQRRIPYSWIGGSYLFTDQHVAEIVRLFEVHPGEPAAPVSTPSPRRATGTTVDDGSSTRLVARAPRRVRAAGPGATA